MNAQLPKGNFPPPAFNSLSSVRKELRELKGRLEAMRADPCRTGPMHAELKIQKRIDELNYREEILWRQQSRIQWLLEGDSNMSFFHRKASADEKRIELRS